MNLEGHENDGEGRKEGREGRREGGRERERKRCQDTTFPQVWKNLNS